MKKESEQDKEINIEPREYQKQIFETCTKENCLVILPTGTGKTLIAIMLAVERFKKFPLEKIPYCLKKYGNTSAVSIPLTIVSQLQEFTPINKQMLFSGFGGGLSWGSTITSLTNCHISKLKEV